MRPSLLYPVLCALLILPASGQTIGRIVNTSPAGAPLGSPDLQVSLNVSSGISTSSSVTVLWNGSPRPTKSGSQIVVTLSAGDLTAPGLNEITIFDNNTGAMWPGGYKFPVYLPLSANDLA